MVGFCCCLIQSLIFKVKIMIVCRKYTVKVKVLQLSMRLISIQPVHVIVLYTHTKSTTSL